MIHRPLLPGVTLLLLGVTVSGCAVGLTTTGPEAIEAEAQDFMAGYAADLLSHDPDAIAARYSRRGAYR